jgi:hypothetical protein
MQKLFCDSILYYQSFSHPILQTFHNAESIHKHAPLCLVAGLPMTLTIAHRNKMWLILRITQWLVSKSSNPIHLLLWMKSHNICCTWWLSVVDMIITMAMIMHRAKPKELLNRIWIVWSAGWILISKWRWAALANVKSFLSSMKVWRERLFLLAIVKISRFRTYTTILVHIW